MCHPIREALADPKSGPIGGEGKVIEADEAYHGKRKTKSESPRRKGRPFTETGRNQKRPIVAFMAATVDKASRLPTDGSARYPSLGTSFAGHETVVHAKHRVSRGRGDAAAEAQVWAKKLASSE
jgi:hypothetical protein